MPKTHTTWTMPSYPALATILFTIAVIGGFALIIDALILNQHKGATQPRGNQR